MGPIIVKIPVDQLTKEVSVKINQKYNTQDSYNNELTSINYLKQRIESFSKPLFLFGQGMHAEKDILRHFPFPFATTIMAKEYGVYSYNEHYIGTAGILGDDEANKVLGSCDILVCVGCRLSERTIMNDKTILEGKNIVYVNLSENICKYKNTVSEQIYCDACQFTRKLIQLEVDTSSEFEQKQQTLEQKQKTFEQMQLNKDNRLFSTDNAIEIIFNSPLATSIFCIDDGLYTLSSLKYNQYGKIVFYGSMAAGGSSIGSAVGSHFACKNKHIVLIIGDGGILGVLGELQTIAKYSLPIIIFLINNNGYESIEQWFSGSYDEEFGAIDFSYIMRGFGIDYLRICDIKKLYEFTNNIQTYNVKPVLAEIVVQRQNMISHFNKGVHKNVKLNR